VPTFLEDRLESGARKRGLSGRRAKQYVYGALNNMGAYRGNKITAKGRRMEAKHKRDMRRRSGRK
jgi:hypothetical protein